MADETDSDQNHSVFANLTLQSFEQYIGPNCTDYCSQAATRFLGYLKGIQDIQSKRHVNEAKSDEGYDEEFWDHLGRNWDIPIYKLDDFIWYCTDDEFDYYTLGQAANWFTQKANEDAGLDRLVNYTLDACPTEFCRALTWEGNPDVSGIGVSKTYLFCASTT